MAILKHIASKNMDYSETQRYLIFQHDEYTNKPILNENGRLIPRAEYFIDGLNCDPFTFDSECMELNAKFNKNKKYNEVKSHHYIISFDPKDVTENGLTGEKAQQLGLEYAKKNFSGHQILVCTHTDGHNESGNIHVHIVLNSLRKFDVEHQDFMERPCDSRAGYKHHQTRDYLIYLKQSVMDMCRRENLHQIDLLTPSEKKITEKEYHAKRRGQKTLDNRNKQMVSDGITPWKTKFQTQKDELRIAIEDATATACSLEEFQKFLFKKYEVTLKISRGRFSYLHPERTKPITGRNLGTNYEKDYIVKMLERNARQSEKNKPLPNEYQHSAEEKQTAPETFVFIKTDLRLVVDLQQCVKAQQSQAYARKVKLSNLKEMAKTVAYVQEHGYATQEDLLTAFSEVQTQTNDIRKSLRNTEQQLKKINEQIHYTGQYLANKSIYSQYLKSKNKKRFRQEHSSEITLYETARKVLKETSGNDKLPSMKMLKAEKEKLSVLKTSQYEAYQNLQSYQKELKTVCANVDMILRNEHHPQLKLQVDKDIS